MEKDLLPLVQQKLQAHKDLCKQHGITFMVTSTYRSIDEQNRLYAKGRTEAGSIVTNAKGGQSFHNWRVAYDVCPIINGKLDWNNTELFYEIGKLGKQVGLEWGGEFPTIKDMPHFQLTLGYSFQDFIDKKVDYKRYGLDMLPDHVFNLLKALKEFQVKQGITDFANTEPKDVKLGNKTLQELRKFNIVTI